MNIGIDDLDVQKFNVLKSIIIENPKNRNYMKCIFNVFILLISMALVSCHEEYTTVDNTYSFPGLVDLNGNDILRGDNDFVIKPEGCELYYQDGTGFLNWNWSFAVKGEDGSVKSAAFDSEVCINDYITISFIASDVSETRVLTIFNSEIDKPYRYFKISIHPNPTKFVREFTLELMPVSDRNLFIMNPQFNFTQLGGY